ncbi:MAG TPA: LON peptidase substrate-binding domain-containing protein [Blastocatellia bacterium]|nr:LON peptidase substrate-binding domain-containing protein [Blastocatellia bacterium]
MDIASSERLDDLPLFPLATVLFPGAILPLHIFEERYKEMMRYAIENGGVFGLSYRSDAAVGYDSLPDVGSVGCLAEINAVMPLEDGRMNIISTGVVRYRLKQLKQVVPFLIASVEAFQDDPEPDADLPVLFKDTFEACKKFVGIVQTLNDFGTAINPELPEEPEAFSLLVSSMLPIDNDPKQYLLEMTSTRVRLTKLRHYVTAALSAYTERLKIQERAKSNGHGKLQA